MTKITLFFCPPIKIKHCKIVHTARGEVVMLQVIAKFIAITKEEGMEEEKKTVVFWSTKSVAKKESFFVPCVIVCFHPIAANGIEVTHGCG